MKALAVRICAFIFLQSFVGFAQTSRLEFEVATIKESNGSATETKFNKCAGGRLLATNFPVLYAIEWAYDVVQPFSLPAWASDGGTHYDMQAKADRLISATECKAMLRSLLEERFKLKVHKEKRETRGYFLRVAKGGAKLQKAILENPGPSDGIWLQGTRIGAKGWDAATIARWLATLQIVGLPVVDDTKLVGLFQFKVDYSNLPAGDDDKPDLFKALQDQMGLKLDFNQNVPSEVLIVDSIQKPSKD